MIPRKGESQCMHTCEVCHMLDVPTMSNNDSACCTVQYIVLFITQFCEIMFQRQGSDYLCEGPQFRDTTVTQP